MKNRSSKWSSKYKDVFWLVVFLIVVTIKEIKMGKGRVKGVKGKVQENNKKKIDEQVQHVTNLAQEDEQDSGEVIYQGSPTPDRKNAGQPLGSSNQGHPSAQGSEGTDLTSQVEQRRGAEDRGDNPVNSQGLEDDGQNTDNSQFPTPGIQNDSIIAELDELTTTVGGTEHAEKNQMNFITPLNPIEANDNLSESSASFNGEDEISAIASDGNQQDSSSLRSLDSPILYAEVEEVEELEEVPSEVSVTTGKAGSKSPSVTISPSRANNYEGNELTGEDPATKVLVVNVGVVSRPSIFSSISSQIDEKMDTFAGPGEIDWDCRLSLLVRALDAKNNSQLISFYYCCASIKGAGLDTIGEFVSFRLRSKGDLVLALRRGYFLDACKIFVNYITFGYCCRPPELGGKALYAVVAAADEYVYVSSLSEYEESHEVLRRYGVNFTTDARCYFSHFEETSAITHDKLVASKEFFVAVKHGYFYAAAEIAYNYLKSFFSYGKNVEANFVSLDSEDLSSDSPNAVEVERKLENRNWNFYTSMLGCKK